MSLDETTPVENQSHTTLSPGGTTVIQGKEKGLFNDSDENVRNPGITPEFLAQNRKQILLLLQKEEKEHQLKEVRARLEFEDVLVKDADEDDAEIEVKQAKETSQPKIQGGRKENHEDGVKSRIAKKLEFEDDYSKPYRPSTARAALPRNKHHQYGTRQRDRRKKDGRDLASSRGVMPFSQASAFLESLSPSQRSLIRSTHVLTGFAGEVVHPIGQIQLPVVVGNETGQREVTMTFLVIRAQSPYDVILGRPGLCLLGAIASTIHSAIKFPTPRGVVTLKSNRRGGRMDRTSRPTSILWTLNRA
ncbi:hypothetical protein E3N88_06195 [Mikania micrantha]|uniref:Uncharacterized protein n=1 Tax=Mikania micrantha TaxID=192012 RepID=A0A5N6PR08_9ASTR|nr:hypothetical protein E3N88_06195 [Mikania micrantha]